MGTADVIRISRRMSINSNIKSILNKFHDHPIDDQRSPIFIVGCSHSGTTLMMALLSRHPHTYVVPYESGILFPDNKIGNIFQFYQEQTALAGNRRLVEKTPRHIFELPRLFRLFPKAQVIAMMRDGRDVAVSIRRRKGTLEAAIRRWINAANCLKTWKDDPKIKIVRYENLVTDTYNVLENLLLFLGIPTDIEQLLHTNNEVDFRGAWNNAVKPITEASSHLLRRREQINKSIYDDRGRWRDEMSPEEKQYVFNNAGTVLRQWGYE